jgi:hypothetical protein
MSEQRRVYYDRGLKIRPRIRIAVAAPLAISRGFAVSGCSFDFFTLGYIYFAPLGLSDSAFAAVDQKFPPSPGSLTGRRADKTDGWVAELRRHEPSGSATI